MEIECNIDGIRIDSYLSEKLDFSRSKISDMIKDGTILVNDKTVKSSYNVKTGDLIKVGEYEEEDINVEPENIPLDIVYEDDDVMVINKPNHMVVHPKI